MKILIVTHLLYPEYIGGREKYVVRLAKELTQRHQVGIVCYVKEGKDVQAIQTQSLRVHGVQWLPKPSPISQIMLILTTIVVTLLCRYEIIYVNSSTAPQLAGLFNKILTRVPYVVAIHGPGELSPVYLPRLANLLKKTVLRNASKVVAVSKEIADLLVQKGLSLKSKVSFIPPGIESELFRVPSGIENDRISEVTNDTKVIITARRLVKEKGIDVLLKAIKILADDGFDLDCIIVGQGPEFESLTNLSRELGIEAKVDFTGFIPEERLTTLIWSANCYVIPSLREGTPLALFESMALGKPIVATNVGGIPDVLPTKELLATPGDPVDLAAKIRIILENKRFANKVSRINRKAAEQYSWNRIAARLQIVLHNASSRS